MFNSIIPVIETYAEKNDFYLTTGQGRADEIFINQYLGGSPISTRLELPFNGHILLALTFLMVSKNKKLIRILIIYQLVLFFIIPFLGWLLINGNLWVSFILSFHNIAYKYIFLIIGFLSIKTKADLLSHKGVQNEQINT